MHFKFAKLPTFFVLIVCSLLGQASVASTTKSIRVKSPDGKVQAELSAVDGNLRFRILVDGRQVLTPSSLGICSNGA